MQIQGTIGNVQARVDPNTNEQRFWQAHGKTNYVYDMSITTPVGPEVGEISSQTANVYPKAIGSFITVNVTDSQYGRKFSAVQEQQGGQQPQQQAPPPQQRPPQNKPRDYDMENTGKCRYGLYAASMQSGTKAIGLANDRAELEAIEVLARYSVFGLPPARQQEPPQQQSQEEYDYNRAFDSTDNIPF